jgi:hypothetical protein
MKRISGWMIGVLVAVSLIIGGLVTASCGPTREDTDPEYSNPFTDPVVGGKEDTGYFNLTGVELHVTLEADVEATGWRMFDTPAYLAQFAVTTLRKSQGFHVELLAEAVAIVRLTPNS